MTHFAGLDISLRSINVCVIDDQGDLVAEGKCDAEAADLVAFLDDLELDIGKVGLEAGMLTQYLTYGLQFAGYDVHCMESRQVKAALSAMRNKTDKHDARGIAQLLVQPCAYQECGKPPCARTTHQSQSRAEQVRRP